MTPTDITSLPAGPELNRLACEVLGPEWAPEITGQRSPGVPFFSGQAVYPPISTDAATAVRAIGAARDRGVSIAVAWFQDRVVAAQLELPDNSIVNGTARDSNFPLAVARALAAARQLVGKGGE